MPPNPEPDDAFEANDPSDKTRPLSTSVGRRERPSSLSCDELEPRLKVEGLELAVGSPGAELDIPRSAMSRR
jgi:hypothetical protein